MKVLLTGATGFVGRNILPQMYNDITRDIAVLVRNKEKTKELFKDYKNIIIINQNEINYKTKIKEFNPTIAIHLASYLTSKRDEETINELINVNIKFGTHLLNALEGTDIKYFINVGTSSEYLYNDNRLISANLYASTKTAFREIIAYYQSILKFKWINIIPYTIYGGQDTQKKIIDLIIESTHSNKSIKMSKGEQILDFIHIQDVTSFFIKIVKDIKLIQNDFTQIELGTGKGTSIKNVANIVEQVFNKKCNIQWGAIPYREKDVMKAVANIENNINWKPHITLAEGIRKLFLNNND